MVKNYVENGKKLCFHYHQISSLPISLSYRPDAELSAFEPAHEILVLFVLRKLIL